MLDLQLGFKVNTRTMIRIGELARRVGVRSSAIRYYEAHGIVSSGTRLPNGYRLYDDASLKQLRFLRRAQSFGMTLSEIRSLLELDGRNHAPCKRVRELARHHLKVVNAKISELEVLRDHLRSLARRRGKRANAGVVCPIIELD